MTTMKVKLDENLPVSLCKIFSDRKIQADTVFSENLKGCSDEVIIQRVRREGRILITCDLDFADIRQISSSSEGIVVLRLDNRSSKSIAKRVVKFLETIPISDLHGAVTIVSDDRIRMRR